MGSGMRIMRWLFVFSLAVLLHPQEVSMQGSEPAIRSIGARMDGGAVAQQ
jgi:hypothetical protein